MNTPTQSYSSAVSTLLPLALYHDCGGAKAAAKILLNAYNIFEWTMSTDDIMSLHDQYREAAYAVIFWRCESLREPHEVIPDGDKLFRQLAREWNHLSEENRDAA
ncbi:hypothetical protein JCM17960_01110 [Magnetospira thiophila]